MDFLALKGPPPTVAAMQSLADSVSVVLPDTNEVSEGVLSTVD